MGLIRKDQSRAGDKIIPKGLYYTFTWGQVENCTIKEVIDDGRCDLIEWYVENLDGFVLDNEAHIYLRRNCHGNNHNCSCKFKL